MNKKLYNLIISEIKESEYWVKSLGLARAFLATCTLLTIIFNSDLELLISIKDNLNYNSPEYYSIFQVFGNVALSRVIVILVLVIVIMGYFPRFTCIPHFWVSYSFMISTPIIEGGDQLVNILTLLMIPILLFDKRRNHYSTFIESNFKIRTIAYFTFFLIPLQVFIVYFISAISKMNVLEWQNGTAIYYWFNDPLFGINDYLLPMFNVFLKNPIFLIIITWGTIVVELFLAFLFFTRNMYLRKYGFIIGVSLHGLIAICFGLWSFFFAMIGV